MRKILTFLLLLLITYVTAPSYADVNPIKLKKNLIGTWKFANFWNPYVQDKSSKPAITDAVSNTTYTFTADGYVTIWSRDSSKYNLPAQKLTWGIVMLKNSKGKAQPVIRLVDTNIDPKDQDGIEKSTSGRDFYIVKSTGKQLFWIPIPQYKTVSSKAWQTFFVRSED